MMDVSSFAALIRQKYGAYQDVDDWDLANKIVTKYPQYGSQVQFEPIQPPPGVGPAGPSFESLVAPQVQQPQSTAVDVFAQQQQQDQALQNARLSEERQLLGEEFQRRTNESRVLPASTQPPFGASFERTGIDPRQTPTFQPQITPAEFAAERTGAVREPGIKSMIADAYDQFVNFSGAATSLLRGESYTEGVGRRIQEIEGDQKEKINSQIADVARSKLEKGQSISEDEKQAITDDKGFIEKMKGLGTAMLEQPDEFLKEVGLGLIEGAPFYLLTTKGAGAVINAANKLNKLRKLAPLKGVASADELAGLQATEKTREAVTKTPFLNRLGTEVTEDVAGLAAVDYPVKEGHGGSFGLEDVAENVLLGGAVGGGISLFRHAKDARFSRKKFDELGDRVFVTGIEENPNVQAMLPIFHELQKSEALKERNFKVTDDRIEHFSEERLAKSGNPDMVPGYKLIAGEKTPGTAQFSKKHSGPETQIEESVHLLQDLMATDPKYADLQAKVKQWEADVTRQAQLEYIKIPTGDELFAKVFSAHMGYADKFGKSVTRIVLPDEILAGVRALLGDEKILSGKVKPQDGDIRGVTEEQANFDPEGREQQRYQDIFENENDFMSFLDQIPAKGKKPKPQKAVDLPERIDEGDGWYLDEKGIARDAEGKELYQLKSASKSDYIKSLKKEERDGLTGVANQKKILSDVSLPENDGKYIVYMDGDHFKSVNEQFGHGEGDLVIKALGKTFSRHFKNGRVGRAGGEEFVAILPEAPTKGKLKAFLRAVPRAVKAGGEPMTVSVGVGRGSVGNNLYADVLAKKAKEAGRNQAVFDLDGELVYIKGDDIPKREFVRRQEDQVTEGYLRELLSEPGSEAPDLRKSVERTLQAIERRRSGEKQFQLKDVEPADVAGLPDNRKSDKKTLERARQLWKEKGTDSPFFKKWFKGSKVVDESGKPGKVFSGHSNANLFGTKFNPTKATAGGFYFTENPDIAGNYATGKIGGKEEFTRGGAYRIQDPQSGKFSKKINQITLDDNQAKIAEAFIEKNAGYSFTKYIQENARYDKDSRMAVSRGGIKNLQSVHDILEGWGETIAYAKPETSPPTPYFMRQTQSTFDDLLDELGIKWDSFEINKPGVMPVYLKIENPLNTSKEFPSDLLSRLESEVKNKRLMVDYEKLNYVRWTKDYPLKNWVEDIKEQIKTGDETFWPTHIPTRAKQIMQSLGYDGIKDAGGKMGGEKHAVYIAFEPNQIKSATGNRGTFDTENPDIRYQLKDAPEPEGEPKKTFSPLSEPGKGPNVEARVEKIEKATGDIGSAPAHLDRDTKQSWSSLDPEIRRLLATNTDEDFYRILKRRNLDATEVQAMNAITRGKEERVGELKNSLLEARESGDKAKIEKANLEYLEAQTDFITSARAVVNDGTGTARALNARKRFMLGLKPDSDFMLIRKLTKEIPGIKTKDIGRLVRAYRDDPGVFGELVQKAISFNTMDKALEIWKAGLLSAPSTDAANIIGNAVEQFTRMAETVAKGGLDEGIAEISGTIKAFPTAMSKLLKNFKDIVLLKDKPIDLAAKFEFQTGAVGGKFGKLVRTSFRKLEAEDQFFKELIASAELRKRAMRTAKREGLKGKEMWDRSSKIEKEYLNDPGKWPSIQKEIEAAKLDRVFQGDPGNFATAILNMNKKVKAMQVVFPFVKTPANILNVTIERSPVGYIKAVKAWKELKAAKGVADENELLKLRERAVELTMRATLGTAILGGFYGLASTGMMTGGGPESQRENYALRETGWQPYSFVFKDDSGKKHYFPFSRFEPISSILGFAADLVELKDQKDIEDKAGKVLGSITENLTNKSYLQGLSNAVEFIKEPSRYASRYLSSLVGSLVPNVVARAARAIDPVIRDTRPKQSGLAGLPERVGKTIQSRIPFASKDLPAKRSFTGEEVERHGGSIARFASPVQMSTEKPGKEVEKEMARIGYIPGEPSRTMRFRGQEYKLDDDQHQRLFNARKSAAEKVGKVIESKGYKDLDDERKRQKLKRIFDRIMDRERKKIARELVQKKAA